ncbi:MAG: decaprenyl-phosphate phosphoribosyltransferase [Geobacteraceae bacterium]|nr:decaprenyl-phosphate phosphoribosyltransferase [Geobacteraceae bacterium]
MITTYLAMLRPTQWLKNLMLFFPLFLSGHLLTPDSAGKGLVVFCSFCLVSSAGYVFNDLRDRERDGLHPDKRFRAVSSGKVSVRKALVLALALLVSGLILAILVSGTVALLLLFYGFISLMYTFWLKSQPVIDLFCIAAGFLIRLQAGGELFQIPISPWLFLTVFLLAVFLSTGKRLNESQTLGDCAGKHRASLACYPPGFLAGTMYMTGSAVLVTYAMYALHKPRLFYTVPLCLFGLLRYTMRVNAGKGGDPTDALLKDWSLFVVSLAWLLMVVWSIYW